MSVTIFDVEQNTPEWIACRIGIPTASQFHTVMARGRSGSNSKTRLKYMRQLAGERITGEPMESFSNGFTDRGHAMEAEARAFYALMKDVEPQQVGFIRNGHESQYCGCSPDALIGNDGMLELKSKSPHVLIEVLEINEAPSEHLQQIQGQLWVAEREWCDLCCYWPKMPKFIKRVFRDENYIRDMSITVKDFNDELQELTQRMIAKI
jgi:hypothetical protein